MGFPLSFAVVLSTLKEQGVPEKDFGMSWL
jgi:hypothetical protein